MRYISKIILCLLAIKTYAADHSFFLNDDDSRMVLETISKGNRDALKNKQNTELKVSGIFYMDSDNWTVWINDVPYSNIGQHAEFSIDEVGENYVSLSMSNGERIRLSVNC